MTAEPHERDEFTNAVEYTVAITVVVEGGARHGTADRRARRIAQRLADHAARAKHVVDATAAAGFSHEGEILSPRGVYFPRANSGHADRDGKLSRYLDPEHERALLSLRQHNARERKRRQADFDRRVAIGCANAVRSGHYCVCVYCLPTGHQPSEWVADHGSTDFRGPAMCPCGRMLAPDKRRCDRHHDVAIVALDGDPPALLEVADRKIAQE